MSDLGSIGTQGAFAYQNADIAPRQIVHRGISVGGRFDFGVLVMGGKDAGVGNASAPSLRLDARGFFRLYWTVKSGTRTFSITVKQAVNVSPRPRVTIVKNTGIGVNADVTSSAGSGTGFVTIGPITASPSSDGVLEVRLENLLDAAIFEAPCYWDDIVST
jgi:hypothetical protein